MLWALRGASAGRPCSAASWHGVRWRPETCPAWVSGDIQGCPQERPRGTSEIRLSSQPGGQKCVPQGAWDSAHPEARHDTESVLAGGGPSEADRHACPRDPEALTLPTERPEDARLSPSRPARLSPSVPRGRAPPRQAHDSVRERAAPPGVTARPFLSPHQVYEILKRTTCAKAKYSMGKDIFGA